MPKVIFFGLVDFLEHFSTSIESSVESEDRVTALTNYASFLAQIGNYDVFIFFLLTKGCYQQC